MTSVAKSSAATPAVCTCHARQAPSSGGLTAFGAELSWGGVRPACTRTKQEGSAHGA